MSMEEFGYTIRVRGSKLVSCDIDEDYDSIIDGPIYIDIPEGITEICQDAFRNIDEWFVLTLPNSLEIIDDFAFYNCSGLGEENSNFLPYNLKQIGAHAFEFCRLTQVALPNSLETIGDFAFANNDIEKIIIPASVKHIGDGVFSSPESILFDNYTHVGGIYLAEGNQNYAIKNDCLVELDTGIIKACTNTSKNFITLPKIVSIDGYKTCTFVEEIAPFAFSGNKNIKAIDICLEKIGYGAFAGCENLNIIIENEVCEIEEGAFVGVKSLRVSDDNPEFKIKDGYLIDVMAASLLYAPKNADRIVFIPEDVERIGDRAFFGCEQVECVDFAFSRVSEIGVRAFSHCKNLDTVEFNDWLTCIEDFSFSDCERLSYVSLPNSIENLGNGAFRNCNEISSVNIPRVLYVGERVFGVDWIYRETLNKTTGRMEPVSPKRINIFCENYDDSGWDANWKSAPNDITVYWATEFEYNEDGIPY